MSDVVHLAQYRYFDRKTDDWQDSIGGVPWCMSSGGPTDENHVVTDEEDQVTCRECVKHLQFVNGWGWNNDIDWFGEDE